ncbi:MAG: peptidyl-tRNA hydrolase Pth2 [Candidatus Aenigmarchaeota archaeon]|nr:peptidyl-tRNA hydrolase Pth2 [Candidatus Aenigmarchaeota archaeon]
MYKQVIVVRSDLNMSIGKTAVQCAHAAVAAAEKTAKAKISAWKKQGQKKVALRVESKDDIEKLAEKCRKLKMAFVIISDAGLTELEPGTTTALAIGPDDEKKIDKITGNLPLLK